MKRAFDIAFSTILLVLLSPVLLIASLVIYLQDFHSPFYFGERVGKDGRLFKMIKLRSMTVNADRNKVDSTSAADPRITTAGHFVRRYKLDELMQLWNVLRGDMSIVGPRPEVKKFVDLYTEEERVILSVRPGITDWSSIKFHNEPEIIAASGIPDADTAYAKLIRPEKLRLQLKYVREHCFLLDLFIIVSTLLTLVSTRFGGNPVGVPEQF